MQLMTKEIEKAFAKYPLYSQDGLGSNAKVVVKYFGGQATWLITEGEKQDDGDWMFFGYVTLGFPDDFQRGKLLWEWGYVTLSQLQEIRFRPFGLGVERDLSVKPGKRTVAQEAYMSPIYSGNAAQVSPNTRKKGFLDRLRRGR